MIRPVLLAALVVCGLGAPFVAVQPVAGDVLSETPTPDGQDRSDPGSSDDGTRDDPEQDDAEDRHSENDTEDGDRRNDGEDRNRQNDTGDGQWYDGWDSDGDDGSDGRADDGADDRSHDGVDNRSHDGDRDPGGADDGPDERDGNGSDDGESPETDGDGADGTNRTHDHARGHDASDERDLWNLSVDATGYVLAVTVEADLDVTDGITPDGDRDGVAADGPPSGVVPVARDLEAVTVVPSGRVGASVTPGTVGGLPDDTSAVFRVGDGTVRWLAGGPPLLLELDGRDDGAVDRPAAETTLDRGRDSRTGSARAAGDVGAGPAGAAPVEAAAWSAGGDAGDRRGDDGSAGDGPAGGSPAGAGAALVVTVGCLGGTRVAITQANLLATPASEGTLAALRRVAGEYLERLPAVAVPPVFGYSRHDGSDPLENETRAAIYDLVGESPGIYHARLAEETGVAVETVRYHCRVLAEEGLVERRKHRGRRRLYPVSMDDGDPELAAAIADSAAADVLSAIERIEPATLSAVAEEVGCAPSTVAYHLDRLEEDGLVSRERDGGAVRVRLRRSTRSALRGRVADD